MESGHYPLVSVLIASYNHEKYIEQALKSVWGQPYPSLELVVVDDCSSDGSWELLMSLKRSSPIKMHVCQNVENIGPGSTVNRALSIANGEFIVIGASDDYFEQDAFSRIIGLFQESPELNIVYGNGRVFCDGQLGGLIHRDLAIGLLDKEPEEVRHYLYTHSSPLFLQSAILRRNLIENVGGFDSSMLADDWLLTIRMFESFHSAREYRYVPDVLVYYRNHDANLHKNLDRQERLKIEFIKKVTPRKFRSEGYSNVYFWAAHQRLDAENYAKSLRYFILSQLHNYDSSRNKFLRIWRKRLKKYYRQKTRKAVY